MGARIQKSAFQVAKEAAAAHLATARKLAKAGDVACGNAMAAAVLASPESIDSSVLDGVRRLFKKARLLGHAPEGQVKFQPWMVTGIPHEYGESGDRVVTACCAGHAKALVLGLDSKSWDRVKAVSQGECLAEAATPFSGILEATPAPVEAPAPAIEPEPVSPPVVVPIGRLRAVPAARPSLLATDVALEVGGELRLTSLCEWIEGAGEGNAARLKAAGFRWSAKRSAWWRELPGAREQRKAS